MSCFLTGDCDLFFLASDVFVDNDHLIFVQALHTDIVRLRDTRNY